MKDFFTSFFRFLERQSKATQAMASLLMVVVVGSIVGFLLFNSYGAIKAKDGAQAKTEPLPPPSIPKGNGVVSPTKLGDYLDGKPVPSPDPRAARAGFADRHAEDQNIAAGWHNRHSGADDPPWIYIEEGDKKTNFVKYKFYQQSDSCLDIVRSKDGKPTEQWLANPLPPHPLHQEDNAAMPADESRSQKNTMSKLFLGFDGTLHAATMSEGTQNQTSFQNRKPVGACWAGIHPGQFETYWGFSNNCWVPFYRRFPDGCLHHQLYNRCANAWDQQIYWDQCVH